MKRYLLFAWHAFEAQGGWRDFKGDYAALPLACKEAERLMNEEYHAHAQLVDSKTGKVVHQV